MSNDLSGLVPYGQVNIAYCPEHGLHGSRDCCFECGKPVEQWPMVPAHEVLRGLTAAAVLGVVLGLGLEHIPLLWVGYGGAAAWLGACTWAWWRYLTGRS